MLVVLFCVIAILAVTPIYNNHVAVDTAQELIEYPLPEQTQYVEAVSAAGKMVGNGNGMQYFGAILIQSELSLEELQAHYSDYTVEKQEDSQVRIIEHGEVEFATAVSGEQYYIVYTWGSDESIFSELDLRGH